MGKYRNQKQRLDPEKLSKVREALSRPQANVIETLSDILAVADSLNCDALVKLLEREIYDGYDEEDLIPYYRKFKIGSEKFIFRRPLKNYPNYREKTLTMPNKKKLPMTAVIKEVVNGIEQTKEWREFKKELYSESLRYMSPEQKEESKGYSIDLSGLKNE